MHELELRERFIKLGIPLRIGPADVAEAQAEADAIELRHRSPHRPAPTGI
jgi:hypothetical protein